MFPVRKSELRISEIADFWASELAGGDGPLRSRREKNLLSLMRSAFWLGELKSHRSKDRLSLLRELWNNHDSDVSFRRNEKFGQTIKGEHAARLHGVPVPNADPEKWSDHDCADAFATLAERWDRLIGIADADPLIEHTEPTLAHRVIGWKIESSKVARPAFFSWLCEQKFKTPRFWGNLVRDEQRATDGAVRAPAGAGRTLKIRNAVRDKMLAEIASRPDYAAELRVVKRESLGLKYKVNKSTAHKARLEALEIHGVATNAPSVRNRMISK